MDEEAPKCRSCGLHMFVIGGTGKSIQITRLVGSEHNIEVVGKREQQLYQCPECKNVDLK